MIKRMDILSTVENKEQILDLFKKYYSRVDDSMMDVSKLYASVVQRLTDSNVTFLTWDNYAGFIICDWKTNPVKKRSEGVIWTVYNPSPEYKEKVLKMLEEEAGTRKTDAIVFFAENPMTFNKLVKDFGYNLTFGYFEKNLKGGDTLCHH